MSGEPRSERERHATVVHDVADYGAPVSGNGWRALQAERQRFADTGRLIGDRDDGQRVGESSEAYARRTQRRTSVDDEDPLSALGRLIEESRA